MNSKMYLPAILILFTSLNGCLVGNKISYEVKPDNNGGTATVTYFNIRSDAANEQEFQEDRNNLFDYMLKSDQFVAELKKEGKAVISRDLYIEGNQLVGKATYSFDNLGNVEGLAHEDGFYFLTLALDDSVVSTNGEVIKSANFKRIIWDESITPLKFEILTEPADAAGLRDLKPFFKNRD